MEKEPQDERAEAAEAPPAEPARPRRRSYGGRRKLCPVCSEGLQVVDYKGFNFLRRFISDRGRIEPRRRLGSCAKHQRALARAIKRARHLALLPYAPEHIRRMGAPTFR